MLKTKIYLLTFIFVVLFTSTGCIKVNTGTGGSTSGVDGGIFKTANYALKWEQKSLFATAAGTQIGFPDKDVADIAMDPSDTNAIYYGSISGGLYYTYDGAENWHVAKDLGRTATIRAVAVDPASKCTIYVSLDNKIYKSMDCSRTWNYVYFDNDITATIDHIEIDHYDSNIIYAAVNRGSIIKSTNAGQSWFLIYELKKRVLRLVIDPNDSRVVYAVADKQIFKSVDGGVNWVEIESLSKTFRDFGLNATIKSIVLIKDSPNLIYVATEYGMVKSSDNGNTWEKIELIPPENKASINDIVIDPTDLNKIYYVTNTTFYKTTDGGKSWTPTKLPTTRAGWRLLIDPSKTSTMYMGVRTIQK